MTRLGDMAFLPYPKCYNSAGWCKMSLKQRLGQSKKRKEKKSVLGHFGAFLPNFGRFGAIFEGSKIEKKSKFVFDGIDSE